MKLSEGKLEVKYKIEEVRNCGLASRLNEMGFTKGQTIRLLKKSPLKKMILLEIRNSTLAIDYDTLSCIEVK